MITDYMYSKNFYRIFSSVVIRWARLLGKGLLVHGLLTSGYLICWNSRWLMIGQVYYFSVIVPCRSWIIVSQLLQSIDDTIISYDLHTTLII